MRKFVFAVLMLLAGSDIALADSLRPPLEKQFFDFFAQECVAGMEADAKSMNLDTSQPAIKEGIDRYCSCTSQAVVSYLDPKEIISFANDATKEPVASKMKPHFDRCKGK
ncbi:MAG: hypothetical protein IPK59_03625 [Rhodospirillaceae bacterium]|nr:hypothetical protein [Rhodospirillaceae bacterium]